MGSKITKENVLHYANKSNWSKIITYIIITAMLGCINKQYTVHRKYVWKRAYTLIYINIILYNKML